MDWEAIADIERLFEMKKINKDDKWDQDIWAGRIESFKANLIERVE